MTRFVKARAKGDLNGPYVDGNKVKIFASKKAAKKAAKQFGFRQNQVTKVQTRFQLCFAIYDAVGGGYWSRAAWEKNVTQLEV